jgi:hypothetical protein
MFMLNNKPISFDTAFTTPDGTQYPANWIRLASPEERAAIGITEVDDAPTYDDRFYWGVDNPKDIDLLKIWLTNEVKVTAGTLLAPTDWKITKSSELGTKVDLTTLVKRAAIRTASNDNEAAIVACTSVEQLSQLSFSWPD